MQNKSDRTSFGALKVRVGLRKFSKSPKQSPKSPKTFSDSDGVFRSPTDSNQTSDGVRKVRSESVGLLLDFFEEKSPTESVGRPTESKRRPSESDGLNWTQLDSFWTRFGVRRTFISKRHLPKFSLTFTSFRQTFQGNPKFFTSHVWKAHSIFQTIFKIICNIEQCHSDRIRNDASLFMHE